MTVSFDFDCTLSLQRVQNYAKSLIERGFDVWVVTSRYDENHKHLYPKNPTNEDMYSIIDNLGIPRTKIIFTNMKMKDEYFNGTKFLFHIEDDMFEIRSAKNNNCSVPYIFVRDNDWKIDCEKILEIELQRSTQAKA